MSREHTQGERARRRAEEHAKVAQKEAERLRETLKSRPGTASAKEAELEREIKNCMVRRVSLSRCGG